MNRQRPSIPDALFHFESGPSPCSYLHQELSTLTYRVYPELHPADLEQLIRRGWRRFTGHVFRPSCAGCRKCISLRVPTQSFVPSRSQRKVLKQNADIRYRIQRPTISDSHVQLYNDWHNNRSDSRGWHESQMTPSVYWENFLMGDFASLHEMLYFDGDELVGVGLVDVMPHSISSVYFFYNPTWAFCSPGTFSGLCEIEYAREAGLQYVYFGYWISDCPSMAYKNRFRPYEILQGLPLDAEEPHWVRPEEM